MKKKKIIKTIFFAYQGSKEEKNYNHIDSIKKTIDLYNQNKRNFEAKSWENYKKGTYIDYEILKEIKKSHAFVCDLTYFNHNVLFELGYAIALDKNITIIIDETKSKAMQEYQTSFLKRIRIIPYKNHKTILTNIEKENFENNLFSLLVNKGNVKENVNDLFFIQGKSERQACLDAIEIINIYNEEYSDFDCTIDNGNEVEYQSLKYYYSNILKSKNVIIHLLNRDDTDALSDNAKKSFFAGLACGLNKNILLIAPAIYKIPLDYEDITIQYANPIECTDKISNWLDTNIILKNDSIAKTKISNDKQYKTDLSLLELGIGCIVAEDEKKEDFIQYFITTASYNDALSQPKSILIGPKGSGKTALFRKLESELNKDITSYVVKIKPESYEIIENIDLSEIFNNERTKETFFIAAWKVVIYSNLLDIIYKNMKNKITNNSLDKYENDVKNFIDNNSNLTGLTFFNIAKETLNHTKNSPDILDKLYKNYLTKLISVLKNYFSKYKYAKIFILSDNLDAMWNQQKYKLDLQAKMISSLFSINNNISNDLSVKDRQIDVHNNLFIRSDIYDYICKNTIGELDKFVSFTKLISWEEYPDKLKTLVEERFRHILSLNKEKNIDEIWKKYFEYIDTAPPFTKIIESIVIRPRDILFFISKLIESAYNKNHGKVNYEDFKYARKHYNKFIKSVWIDELKYEYKNIYEIIQKLDSLKNHFLSIKILHNILNSYKYSKAHKNKLLKRLFSMKYLTASKNGNKIHDFSIIEKDFNNILFRLINLSNITIKSDAFYS